MENVFLPVITLAFQSTSSIIIFLYILRESVIINWVIQILFTLSSEPLLFLFYGNNVSGFIRKFFRNHPRNNKKVHHWVINVQKKEATKSSLHDEIVEPKEDGKLHIVESTSHPKLWRQEAIVRCIGVGRATGLLGAITIYTLYTPFIYTKFGDAANALFFRDFNIYNDTPSVMGIKYYKL